MEAHDAAGNPAEALRAFEDLRRLLREELGTAPGVAAMALHERLLHGRAPAAAGRRRPRRRSPPAAGRRRSTPRAGATRSSAARPRRRCSRTPGRARPAARAGWSCSRARRGSARPGSPPSWPAHAHDDGAVVLYGRFDEDAPAPYQPVVQMLRGWAGGASLAPLAGELGPRAAELGIVLPEFGAPSAAPDGTLRAGEADAQRLRLFDAMAALLVEIAGAAPLLVVLDDLHWADLPTLQLVAHLVRAPAPERVAVPRDRRARTRAARRSSRCSPACAARERSGGSSWAGSTRARRARS